MNKGHTFPDDRSFLVTALGRVTKQRRLQLVLRVGFAITGLVFLFTRVPIDAVADSIRTSRPLPIGLAFAAALAIQVAIAERLSLLTGADGDRTSTGKVLIINLATRFYSLFLPGGNLTGAAIRVHRLGRDKNAYAPAAAAVTLDRIAATGGLCLTGGVFWLAEQPAGAGAVMAVFVAVLCGLGLVVGGLSGRIRLPNRARQRLSSLMAQWSDGDSVEGVLRISLQHTRGILLALTGLSVLSHLLGVLAYYSLGAALGLTEVLSFVTIGWVRSAVILATMIPITISGIALREGAVLLLLAAYGVASETALAFSLLVFTVTALAPGLVGGLLELRRTMTLARSRSDPGVN